MSSSSSRSRRAAFLPKLVDLVVYVAGVLLVVVLVSTLLAAPLAGTFLFVKYLLFLIGFVLLAYGTFLLWPAKPVDRLDEETNPPVETGSELSPFESLLARALSDIDDRYPPTERFSPGLKVFVAGCAVLVVSYLMEALFAVGVE